MRIIDNFLHKKDFKEIQEWILEPSCRWSYSPCVVDPNDEEDEDPAAYQFVNMIYYSRTVSYTHLTLPTIYSV